MKILVTGGAGYIGSHTCKALFEAGHEVLVYDNLSTGHRELVRWGDFEYGDIRDTIGLRAVLHKHRPDGCIHFASFIAVGESVTNPGKYYNNNVMGSLSIMEALRDEGLNNLVVSGTAAVYGLPDSMPIVEASPLNPINPYGRTKLIMEWILEDFARAHSLNWMSLRYFNAAGCDPEAETGEWHEPETHLIPNVLRAIDGEIPALCLYGDDYDTQDGTCIRDYIHVCDLASAHILALEHLLDGKPSQAINLGNGNGISVKKIIETARRVTGKPVPHLVEGRREGDPARLIADASRAREVLGWFPRYPDIETIIETAWHWKCTQKV